jgi:Na+-driven multidrug efflux pump
MQSFWSRYFALIMPLILLALPLLGAYLALNGMTVVDTIMAGRLSSTDLAAIAVGSSVFIPLILLTFGILMATTPLVAQAVGSGRIEKLSSIVNQATWVAVLILLQRLRPNFVKLRAILPGDNCGRGKCSCLGAVLGKPKATN